MGSFFHNLRHGARLVVKNPGFSLVVTLTVALAIGANAVIFSFANVLILRPLPIKDDERVGFLHAIDPQRDNPRALVSIPDFLAYRDGASSFESLAAFARTTYTLTGRGEAVRLVAQQSTSNLFNTWQVAMAAGRGFLPGEDAPGASPVALLSHGFWIRRFAADPGVIGQALVLNGAPHTVIGVVSPEVEFGNLRLIDVWTPLTLDSSRPRDDRRLTVCGRLRSDVSLERADAEVKTIARRLQQEFAATNTGWDAHVISTRAAITGRNTPLVLALLGFVVGFVLLIACANIANLLLARAVERRRELAIRAALGASRSHIVSQLIVESLTLGIAGGGMGLLVAYGGFKLMRAFSEDAIFRLVSIDRNVLLFALAISLLAPMIFSLLPAIHAARSDLNEPLKSGGTRTGAGVQGRRSRGVLVVSQLALAMTLLVTSTLTVRTLIELSRLDFGFPTDGLLTLQLDLPEWKYRGDAEISQFYAGLVARLRRMPGVSDAGAISSLPLIDAAPTVRFSIDGQVPSDPKEQPWAVRMIASDAAIAALGVPLLQGRLFAPQDAEKGQRVALVSREAARRYFGDVSRAVRRHVIVQSAGQRQSLEIVGVIGDTANLDANAGRSGARNANQPSPQLYLPLAQFPQRSMRLVVRSAQAAALVAPVAAAIRSEDADLAVYQVQTFGAALDSALSSSRVLIGLFVSFALVALLMAAAGLYGVVSYSVSQRTQEIGVRLALGATARDIQRMILGEGARLTLVGAVVGLLGGLAVARAMTTILYGVSPTDPSTYGVVALILGAVALAASYVPARRATRVDPIRSLRME